MAQSSDSSLPQPPSSSASQTSQASIASVAQPGNASACLTHTSSLGPWILDSGASDHLSGNKDLFSSITTTSDLPTVTLANGSQTVAKVSQVPKMVPRFPLCRRRVSHVTGKHTRVSLPKRLNNRAKSPFELVHTDVWGPCRMPQFTSFMSHHGILHQSSCAHTPQQNGVAERKNRHLVETAPFQSHEVPLLGIFRTLEGLSLLFLETHRYFISVMSPSLRTHHSFPPLRVSSFQVCPFPLSPTDAMPLDHFRFIIAASCRCSSPFSEAPVTHFLSLGFTALPRLLLMTYPLLCSESTHEALSHPVAQAMVDEMALHSNGTWDLVVLPSGKSTVGCRWVYAVKVGPDGQFMVLIMVTHSPCCQDCFIRLLLSMVAMCSWPLYQLDIKNAFLHGDLAEEVYMEQPPGFVAQGESGLVCRLRRSLYGLKQSPRAWFSRFSSVVQEFGMLRSTADHSVFYHHNSLGQCIYLVVYVDDIVITGSDQDGIQKLKQHLFTHFQTKDLGKLKYFLGIEIAQSSSGVVLSQRKYALDILEETGMLDCKPVDTPMDPNVKLVPGQGEPLGDPGRYRRLVGKLNYLTITRPDISFPVSVVSQFLQSPCDSHWDAVIRILRYIKSTPGQGVLYENRGHTQVVGYTDADWWLTHDRRSTWSVFLLELRFGKDEQMKLICDNQPHYILHPIQSFMKGLSILKFDIFTKSLEVLGLNIFVTNALYCISLCGTIPMYISSLFLANLLLFLGILISIAISLIWRLRILKVSHIYPHS
ncbi:hypothetical protein AAG906_015263 [Vitis piasezkii]